MPDKPITPSKYKTMTLEGLTKLCLSNDMNMATATETITVPEAEQPFTLKLAHHDASYLPIARYQTIDGLLKSHAAEPDQTPLICYPKSTASDFELHTGRDLDQFVDAAVQFYVKNGLQPAVSAHLSSQIVFVDLTSLSGS